MARAHFVKKARKAQPEHGIKVGDSYYWWEFRYGGKHVSKTAPRQSQLTQSDYLSRVYSMLEYIEDMNTETDFESAKDELLNLAEELRDEQDEKLNNMPDQLQDSETGELLRERYDALENFHTELDNIEIDIDEEDFNPNEEWEDFFDGDSESEEQQREQYDSQVADEKEEWLNEKKEAILEEFQNLSIDA